MFLHTCGGLNVLGRMWVDDWDSVRLGCAAAVVRRAAAARQLERAAKTLIFSEQSIISGR